MKVITRCILVLACIVLSCKQNVDESDTTLVTKAHSDLESFFKTWRTFENPPLIDGVPDYTEATFNNRLPKFKTLQSQLMAMDTTGWSIPERVDWHIVWAEMNGYDFNHRILKPWQRDPAYYKVLWMDRSDVPAHEGPTNHAIIELWQYKFPLDQPSKEKLLKALHAIPNFYKQAQQNLTGNARELWIAGIRDIRNQTNNLKTIRNWESFTEHADLVTAIDAAIAATNTFVQWLQTQSDSKTGPSGIGKDNYTWYLQNVHLVPLTWEDEVLLLKRELARAWSSLKLEEHRNRHLPELPEANTVADHDAMVERSVKSLMHFLENDSIVSVKDYFEPALREHLGGFVPKENRNFFLIGKHIDARPLYSHFYHWFELARMDLEPHQSEIRKGPLLYNIFDSRNEGTATAVEELVMNAGLYDDDPRVREIVYIMIAQRAARGLGSLYAHANEMTMEEAGSIHSEYTPRGWMKTEKELLIFEQHLYLRQPGYGTSYITGKYLLEAAMMDYGWLKEKNGETFKPMDFFDKLNAIGNIPISLGHWELTGIDAQVKQIKQ
ncbi:hypothetical protein [Winogradskyella immobilis]|uniref:DUF885 domain-containing protein n=1 Tax=Winogradskyella immobilis TaxID=2816852 RepID=A0ABS8EJE7_9FLAO|nr:hypothetical protein [Winogradskyella immobilis]MCC1483283.1 hypothetical protein [Winogradskyella immobilis]MCG0015377.1 hypothetical protein [Winogradskyella immobilis]